jgi:tetratricopeptide (TPR) repeat protein
MFGDAMSHFETALELEPNNVQMLKLLSRSTAMSSMKFEKGCDSDDDDFIDDTFLIDDDFIDDTFFIDDDLIDDTFFIDDEFNDADESPHAQSPQECKMHGERLLAIRDYEGAINSFTDAIDLLKDALLKEHVDDLVSCLNNRAACFFILDRYEDAALDVSQVLERYPHDLRAFDKRALMFERAGQLGKALEDYQSALKLKPNWTKVSLAVERLSANGITTPKGFDNNLRFMHGYDQSSQDSDSDRKNLSCDAASDDNDDNDEFDSDDDDETEGAPIHYKKGFIGEKIGSVVVCTIDHQLLPKEGS